MSSVYVHLSSILVITWNFIEIEDQTFFTQTKMFSECKYETYTKKQQ